jgi:hypothetical protein
VKDSLSSLPQTEKSKHKIQGKINVLSFITVRDPISRPLHKTPELLEQEKLFFPSQNGLSNGTNI